jgi:hypothetical protein
VEGESFYRKNIEDVSNYMGEDEGIDSDDFIASLILEDDNPYDPGNAVRVEIDGKVVGHLSRPNSKRYRARLELLNLVDVVGECYASIKGGFHKRDGTQADFGVRLDLDLKEFDATLPPKKIEPPINEPAPLPTPVITPQPTLTENQPVNKPIKFGGRIAFIPIGGSGLIYWFFIFPFIAIIDLYILLFAGLWYLFKWLYETAAHALKRD